MDRDKSLDMALGQIEKQFGKGAIMKLGEEAAKLAQVTLTPAESRISTSTRSCRRFRR